jgi:membrane protease YdiL (CAAX protease family)
MIPPDPHEPDVASADTGSDPSEGLRGSADDPDWRPAPLGPLLGVIGALAASNVMSNAVLPDWAYVPWNLAVAAGIVAFAIRTDEQTMASMGLSRAAAPRGLRLGITLSAALVGVYAIGLAIPTTRGLFMDERADVPFLEMAFKVLVEVPLGTVLLEEVAFRGVLPAMFRRRVRPSRRAGFTADAAAAGLFGLWHILPSWNVSDVNPVFRDVLPDVVGQAAGIVGGVVLTAVAGMGLSWMRNRSDSVVAPATLHATSNGVGSALAWLAHRVI